MISTIIFDVGGTLMGAPELVEEMASLFEESAVAKHFESTEFAENPKEGLAEMILKAFLIHYGQASQLEEDFKPVGEVLKKTLSEVSSKLKTEDVGQHATEMYQELYLNKSWLFEDTHRTLSYFKEQGVELIVASDADTDLLHLEFEKHDLKKYFDHYFISEALEAYKPSEKFLRPIRQLVERAKEKGPVLFVGDSTVDVLSGQKLGITTVLKTGSKGSTVKADYVITNLEELIEISKAL